MTVKIGFPQAMFLALALSPGVLAQTAPECARYDAAGLRLDMGTRDVWSALRGKGDSIGTANRPAGTVAVVRYTSSDPMLEVEYDRADIGKNRGVLVAVRSRLAGDLAQDPTRLVDRFGEPTTGADKLAGGASDGPVEWVDLGCRVTVRLWLEPAAWWDPGSATTWLEIRRLDAAEVPVVATAAATPASATAVPVVLSSERSPAADAATGSSAEPERLATDSAADPSAAGTTPSTGGPVAVAGTDGVTIPVRIPESYVAPVYPRIAAIAGLDGVVRVQARIGTNGEVLEIVAVDATPQARGFEQAAADAIRNWRFTPAVLDGAPVEVLMPLVVEFQHRR